jgi:hypothetical protein
MPWNVSLLTVIANVASQLYTECEDMMLANIVAQVLQSLRLPFGEGLKTLV